MSENNENQYVWGFDYTEDDEIPAWKRLDIVTRKWAVQSMFQKDLEKYEIIKREQSLYS